MCSGVIRCILELLVKNLVWMELSPLLSHRSVTVTRAGRVSTVTRNVPNMAPSLVAGVIVMLGGGDQSVTSQGALGSGWTVPVMVCVTLPPMCVPAFRGGVEMDATSQTAQGLRTVTTEGCATPPWIDPPLCLDCQQGWMGSACEEVCEHGHQEPPNSGVCQCDPCYSGRSSCNSVYVNHQSVRLRIPVMKIEIFEICRSLKILQDSAFTWIC